MKFMTHQFAHVETLRACQGSGWFNRGLIAAGSSSAPRVHFNLAGRPSRQVSLLKIQHIIDVAESSDPDGSSRCSGGLSSQRQISRRGPRRRQGTDADHRFNAFAFV